MKKLLSVIFVLLFGSVVRAEFCPTIPNTTLQIAKKAEMQTSLQSPKSQLVKIGIGDNSFKAYDYSQTTIFGTGEITVYDISREILKLPVGLKLAINLQNDTFILKASDGKYIYHTKGPVKLVCNDGFIAIDGLKRAGKQAMYRGEIHLVKYDKRPTRFHIVNVLPLEDYLRGVVPNEMPVSFGLEALKAQSVAARNYVLSPRIKAFKAFDVVDSVASQVYFGVNSERELANRAVMETEGIVATYRWKLILAQYSSTAGGYTESFSNTFSDPKTKKFPSEVKPYLIARPDMLGQKPLNREEDALEFYKNTPVSYDMNSPYYRWQRVWTKDELQSAIQNNLAAQSAAGFVYPSFKVGDKLSEVKRLEVKRRGESGKIMELEVVTTGQNYRVYKEIMIRRLLKHQGKALPSANIVFEHEYDENGNLVKVIGYGGGFGHGVGMSQFGAGYMATKLHKTFDEILQHYYTGITLSTKPVILSYANPNIYQTFYASKRYAQLVIDNKYQLSYFLVNINGKEQTFQLEKNIFNRVERIDISQYIKKGKNEIIFRYPSDEDKNKGIRLFVELVAEKDDNN